MPLYYFDLDECGFVTTDDEGSEMESIGVATDQAIAAARGIMASEVELGAVCLDCHIDILNSSREQIIRISFAQALKITGGGVTASDRPAAS